MTSSYDSTGVTLDRYSDILAKLIELCQEEWGESVNVDEDGFLGHMIRLIALLISESNEVTQAVYDTMSVGNSTGTRLASLVELIGLERQAAAYSTATLTLTATKATTVPAGSQYKTAAGVTFATDTALVFTAAGTDTVESTCTVVGDFDAAIGEIDTIVTSVFGISAVDNDVAAIPGRYQETSTELKERHTVAVATSGEEDAASIYEAVSEVTGVSSTLVFDNDTKSVATDGTPANSMHIVVIGGSDEAVATAITNTKTASVTTYGSESYAVYNDTTRQEKTIYFDRAAAIPIYITLVITTNSTAPEDWETQVRTNLLAEFDDLRIGDDVIYNSLYRPIYNVAGITVTSMFTGIAASPTGTANITIDNTERATLATGNIVI